MASKRHLYSRIVRFFSYTLSRVSKNCTIARTEVQVMRMCWFGVSRATLTIRSLSSSLTPWQRQMKWEGLDSMYNCMVLWSSVMVQRWNSGPLPIYVPTWTMVWYCKDCKRYFLSSTSQKSRKEKNILPSHNPLQAHILNTYNSIK